MAKKFVRGVTGVDDIESFDKTLTNVNDILSDGQNTYVHTKKGKVESYYNLTDNVKTISSDDSTLITLTKDDTTNTATLHPKHDALKEQSLESKDDTIIVMSANNGTNDKTDIRVNPTTVLLHGQLEGENGIVVYHQEGWWGTQVGLSNDFLNTVNNKQNTITNNTSIGVSGTGLRQLYTNKQSYSHTNGILKTHVKSVSSNTSVTTSDDEYNFIVKINKGETSANFTLNTNDTTNFSKIMSTYGSNNTVNISGCVFTLSGSTLTVSTANNTEQNYVISFSDILD